MVEKMRTQISLRWKWSFILTGVFIALYFVTSMVMLWFLRSAQLQSEHQIVQQSVGNLMSVLQEEQEHVKTIQDYVDVFNGDTTPRARYMAAVLRRDDIIARIMDRNHTVIYETPASVLSDSISSVHFERSETFSMHATLENSDKQPIGSVQFFTGLTHYHNRMQDMYRHYTWVSIVSVILCAVLGFTIAHYFFLPIKHMTQIMMSLKEDALSKKRMNLSKRRSDELTELSVGFNELLDTMDLYINQQKQFVEDVSHELRTPVAIVEGHLKLLNRWGKDDPQVLEESLDASLHEIERMKTLVQEMLDLSRAEQVGIHYKNEVTEVLGLIYQIHQNFGIINETFQFNLEIDVEANQEIYVPISRHHLEQVLIILLDNAVKYSTDKPYIHISLSRTVNHVQISIQDFGEGISEEDLAKVFGRFYRVDKARSRHKGGNGLGLSIAKELIEGYKGTIHIESVVNSGSTVRIELPIMPAFDTSIQEKRKSN